MRPWRPRRASGWRRSSPIEDQERLGVQIVLGTGPADEEIVRYANEQAIDLAIVQASPADAASSELAQTVLAGARSAVLVLR